MKLDKLQIYQELLLKHNENINLTTITDVDEIRIKHFMDSTAPIKHFKFEGSCIDIGTGAGFPGIPLAIQLPDVHFTLLDSTAKRINFLNTVINELSLNNVSTIVGRAEEIAHTNHREAFNISTSRAVAHLRIVAEYCLPFLKVGGFMLAYKARDIYSEIEESKEIVKNLGGKIVETIEYSVENYERSLVIIEKTEETPKNYPRKQNQIKNQPI
ncbi:MAG: 16S rRNA (guanine(527)-N(7))-methyltransferase RsmG [Defluviitaleaceae bacterium]|nr:16S rRNA (guanine(527)-N(7))-methyltransferase RsmG [Defluviitaleaceae bacterium]